MPEFILDHGTSEASKAFRALDSFTQGYIEAAFFTSTGPDNAEEGLGEASFAEIAPASLTEVMAECAKFQTDNAYLLERACERSDYDWHRAGVDYWLTRNGHGAGFWDRKELEPDNLGDRLSDACRHHESNMYRGDDGLIYFT